jgi:TPP-dependent 2-oxoacid decarboxylase
MVTAIHNQNAGTSCTEQSDKTEMRSVVSRQTQAWRQTMEMLSGAEMVVRSLIDQGVKQVFGYPGGAVLDIYDALHTVGGIDHVLVRHEQAAVHMADGLARATGEVGVVLVTGPGATNAITGIATAYMDSIPLVVLSGQVATSLIGYDAFQECDMVGISRPVVKHSFLVKQTEDIPGVLKKAFWLASSGRPGPVVVDLPKDILNPANKLPYVWPDSVSMRSYNPTTHGHKGQIKRALQTLVAAKHPVVYGRWCDHVCLRTATAYAGREIESSCGLVAYGAGGVSGIASSGVGYVGYARYLRSQHDHASLGCDLCRWGAL